MQCHLFRFLDSWARDTRCEAVVRVLWNSTNLTGYAKSMFKMSEEFKEYMGCNVKVELRRIEELLKDEKRWYSSEHDVKTYKALEA